MPTKEPTTHNQTPADEAFTASAAASNKDKQTKVEELNLEGLDINSTSTGVSAKSEVEGDSPSINKASEQATSAEPSSQASPAASSFEATASKAAKSEDKTSPKSKQLNSSGNSKKSATPPSTSLTPTDISHLTSIKNAVGTAGAMRPMLRMQKQMPNIPFMMEKGVLEVPVKQVKAALEYYEKLQKQGKELNEAQKKIVEEGESVLGTLKELQGMQKRQEGVTMVDDPKEGECGVM